jgi:hypothetical protein
MPVDQTGENILFVVDGGMVEAHIQIQYTGDAMRFAWVLPLPAAPESLRIGSGPLFTSLLNSTVPSYGFSTVCGGQPLAVDGGGGVDDGQAAPATPLSVVTKVVGAFEVSILEGGSADEVIAWLNDNGYEQIPEAEAIFEEYLDQGHVFAALKLTGGTGIDEIHPIVVRYRGDEPCVPLKLTRVAATEDMAVRTFFLGNERFVPSNYKHVTLNPAALDWSNFAANYLDVVSQAVDSPVADGHAFITEYAGSSAIVSRFAIYSSYWDADALLDVTPAALIQALEAQGFMVCRAAACTYNHPLIEALLMKHLPPPSDVDADAFYDCIPCFLDDTQMAGFDSTAFAADFLSRIVVPGRDASTLLAKYPFLTRMLTTISPSEMTADPEFHAHGTEMVSNFNQVTRALGDGITSAYQVTPDWIVELDQDGAWPEFDDMPAALRIEEYQPDGDRIELVDFSEDIEAAIDASNEEQEYTGTCDAIGLGAAGAPASSSTTGVILTTGNTGGTTGDSTSSTTDGGEMMFKSANGGGCSCSFVHSKAPDVGWGLLGLVGFGWIRRRARPS